MYHHNPALHGRPWNERDFPLGMTSLSLMGLPRNMMGVENYSLGLNDDRALVEEMAEHMLYWNLEMAKKVFDVGISLDFNYLWEDICYKTGPLFSPRMMRKIMLPRWRKYTDYLRNRGVPVILIECDVNLDEFLPLVLEWGINGVLPFEVAADNDILHVRKKYGRGLIIFGGVDKRALAKGKTAIDVELDTKVCPMLEKEGYFPMVDHYVPPDVSFANYMYYKMRLKGLRTSG